MIKGINLGETEEKISKFDDGNPKTIWKIGVLDSITISEIRDKLVTQELERSELSPVSKTVMNVHMADVEYVRHGLKGFINFSDSQGNPILYDTERRYSSGREAEVLAEGLLKLIPPQVIEELAGYIKSKNRMSLEEIKNSGSQLKHQVSVSTVTSAPQAKENPEAVITK